MIWLPTRKVIVQVSAIKRPPFSSPRLRSRTLLLWLGTLACLDAAPTQEQIRTALGSPPELTWTLDGAGPWNADAYGVFVEYAPVGSVHALETTVTGPGVASLGSYNVHRPYLHSVWIDGVRATSDATRSDGRVAVGPGEHTIRWQAVRSAVIGGPLVFNRATWEPFTLLPLATAAAGTGVTLSSPGPSPWIGQDRWHEGDGSAAWSGIRINPPPPGGVANDTPLRADFSGSGVFCFQARTDGNGEATCQFDGGPAIRINSSEWTPIRRFVGAGDHHVEWHANAFPDTTWRGFFEAAVDEIALLPLVPVAEALDTPGWAWTVEPASGEETAPYGIPDATARGGSMVVADRETRLSTTVTGPGLLKIRSRRGGVSLSLNGSSNHFPIRVEESLPDGWNDWIHELQEGENALTLTGWDGEIDFVEVITPPESIATPLGLAEGSFTTGGANEWSVVPDLEGGDYGAWISASRGEGERKSWLDMPVMGPAEVSFVWKAAYTNKSFGVLVDGAELVRMDGPRERIRIELPAGPHTVRWLARPPDRLEFYSSASAMLADIKVSPLRGDGAAMAALGLSQPLALSGEWKRGTTFGSEALEAPAPGSTEVSSHRKHKMQARFVGPGELSFRWYAGADPATGLASDFLLKSPDGNEQWASRYSNSPPGWQEERIPLPPGDRWLEWSVSGAAKAASLAALDDVVFTPAPPVPLDQALDAPELAWVTDPAHPWTGVMVPDYGGDIAISPPLVKGESARLATTVEGPGWISFRWRDFRAANSRIGCEFRINDEIRHETEDSWGHETVDIVVPLAQTATLEWIALAHDDEGYPEDVIGLDAVTWTPAPERPLTASLDAPASVVWSTEPRQPFSGRDDEHAEGGTSAYIALSRGDESWLEATVKGPGIFDFWLLGREPSDLTNHPWDYWSLTIDGQPVAMDGSNWSPQWITGDGTHRIRLTLRNPQDSEFDWIAGGVDQVSWVPLKKTSLSKASGLPDHRWRTSRPDPASAFSSGGRDDDGCLAISPRRGTTSWVETTVQGPCELSWHSGHEGDRDFFDLPRVSLQVDGVNAVPILAHEWEKMRLTLPAGLHVVRWISEPWSPDEEPPGPDDPVAVWAVWKLSGMEIRQGLSPLAEALDAPGLFALETSTLDDRGGMPVTVEGEDAWEPAPLTSLYFFNPREAGTMTARWGGPNGVNQVWSHRDGQGFSNNLATDEPEWQTRQDRLQPGSHVRWTYAPKYWLNEIQVPPLLDHLAFDSGKEHPLKKALESPLPVTAEGWVGRDDRTAKSGGDCAWSFINRNGYGSSGDLAMTVKGPVRLSCWWKRTGSGTLKLHLDGAMLPVPEAGEEWSEIEFFIGKGSHVVRWVHAADSTTGNTTPGEAWLDGIRIRRVVSRSLGESAGFAPLTSTGPEGLLPWQPVAHRESDGSWTEAARVVSGSRVLRAAVKGPAVLEFRGRCFGDLLAAPPPTARAARISSEFVGETRPKILGHFISVEAGGVEVLRIADDPSGGWQEGAVHVPAAVAEVTFRLMAHRGYFGESVVEATAENLQGWVDDLRIVSPESHYHSWAATAGLPALLAAPETDADDDGASNELEYFFSTVPGDRSSRPPALAFARIIDFRGNEEGYQLRIPYLPPHASGTLEFSSDLEHWQPSPTSLLHYPPSSSWFTEYEGHTSSYHVIRVFNEEPRQYYRLRFPSVAPASGE